MNSYMSVLLALALVLSATPAFGAREYQVGVSPLVLDLGTIKSGEEKVANFFIVTASTEDILVNMDSLRGNSDFFKKPEYAGFISGYSEEDTSAWIMFPSNPVVLSPQKEALSTPAGQIFGWRRVNFVVRVPPDAEPGYHIALLRPSPYVSGGKSLGVNIVAVSSLNVFFRVPGEASRSGQVLDIIPEKYDSRGAQLSVFFKNTGTVTVMAEAKAVEIYNSTGSVMESRQSGGQYINPGDTQAFTLSFDPEKVRSGTYDVSARVEYLTGSATKNAEVAFSGESVNMPAEKSVPRASLPWWVFAVPVVLFLLLYSRRGRNQR